MPWPEPVTSATLPSRLNSDSDMAYPRKLPEPGVGFVCADGASLGKQFSND
jgi:hypothetical protein